MKRIVTLVCVVMSVMALHAKDYLGFQIGFAQSVTRLNAPVLEKKTELNPTMYNGMEIGILYDGTIIKGFGVTMGVNYTFGVSATDWTSKNPTISQYPKVRSRGQYHQIEIPVEWQYKFEIAQRTWLILYTGPTIQCGLSFNDKWYYDDGVQDPHITHKENLYSKEDMNDYALKRLNVTWGVGAGFQYERYFLRGGYDFGMINPYKAQKFDNVDISTRGRFDQWQVKIGMYFWESKK